MNAQPLDPRAMALKEECLNQFQNCGYTALAFTIWLRSLRRLRALSWIVPVILGAVATWTIVGETMPWLAATCAFVAVLIPPTFQAAKIDASIKQYTVMAGEFTNLRDRFRLTAEYASLKPFDEFEAAFNTLFTRLEKARVRSMTPPHVCFLLARRQWQRGYYQPDGDHRSGKTTA